MLRYVVLNPVRAHMVQRPEDYKWSSYRATAGYDEAPEWLDLAAVLRSFILIRRRQSGYREFVCAKIEADECLWDKLTNRIYLGTEEWTRAMRKIVETTPRSTDHPKDNAPSDVRRCT